MIEAKISKEDLKKIINKLEKIEPKKRGNILTNSFRKATLMIESRLKGNISGNYLKVRTGRLRTSIGSKVGINQNGLYGVVGSGIRQGKRVKYADIHETGGTITPKRVRRLTIPLPSAQTKAGVTRGRARDFKDTFIRGNIIYQKVGKKKIVPLFVLKKKVRIPARKYLTRTLRQTEGNVTNIILNEINRVLAQ